MGRLSVAVTVLSLWPTSILADQSATQVRMTIGTVALLVKPQAAEDLRTLEVAARDSDPAVRAMAARVAGLRGRKELAITLQNLLSSEKDLTAAVEQVRALLYLQGSEALPAARAAADRLGAHVGSTIGEWLARGQPDQFAAMLPSLLRGIPESDTRVFGAIAALAARQTLSARESVATSLAAVTSGPAWREFLVRLPTNDPLVLGKGLGASTASVREATIWFVLTDTAEPGIATADLKAALDSAGAPTASDDTEWASFGRELLSRRVGNPGVMDGSSAITRHARAHSTDAAALAALPELTAGERSALKAVMPDLPARTNATSARFTNPPSDAAATVKPQIRTFPPLMPGAFASVLATLGCSPPSDPAAFGAARVSFRRDGRPKEIALDATTLSAKCAPFVDYLARLTVAPAYLPVTEDAPVWLFTSIDKDTITCLDTNPTTAIPPGGAARVGGKIAVPHKTKDVKPLYPESMRLARIAGVVVMQATITATGCIVAAEVLRSVELPLDAAALKAVSGWRFEPTQLDGIPVPVIMTVTVNFNLR